MKKETVQINRLNDIIDKVSPASVIKTPEIIGFLTYLYSPPVTSFFGGLQGARVPFPIRIKDEIVIIRRVIPTIMSNSPGIKVQLFTTRMFFSIYRGIKIRTVIGRIREKNCLMIFFNMLNIISQIGLYFWAGENFSSCSFSKAGARMQKATDPALAGELSEAN